MSCQVIIIGLGNPGLKYKKTRHNLGFMVLDAFSKENNFPKFKLQKKFLAKISEGALDNKKVLLVKPQTFMNSTGKIATWLKKRGIQEDEVVVIHDDLEKPFGTVSVKEGGSARGHNGVKSLMDLFGPNFYRLRCGIGRPEKKSDVADYVLSNFTEGEVHVEEMIQQAISQIEGLLS